MIMMMMSYMVIPKVVRAEIKISSRAIYPPPGYSPVQTVAGEPLHDTVAGEPLHDTVAGEPLHDYPTQTAGRPKDSMWRCRRSACSGALVSTAVLPFFLAVVHAYPSLLACDRNITKGAVIMGAAVAESGENPIRLADLGGHIPCGGSLARGASGLTFSWPFAASLEHFIIEATASAGGRGEA